MVHHPGQDENHSDAKKDSRDQAPTIFAFIRGVELKKSIRRQGNHHSQFQPKTSCRKKEESQKTDPVTRQDSRAPGTEGKELSPKEK